jgi:hypothetical protein
MPAPLIDKRTPADLRWWAERLVACPRLVPGPALIGAVLARDVVDPAAPAVAGGEPVPVATAGTLVDEDLAAALADRRWLPLADVLSGGELPHDLESPASRRVHRAGPVGAALAGELAELARIAGPEVLTGLRLGAGFTDPARGRRYRAGAAVDAAAVEALDRLCWVRARTWQPPPGGPGGGAAGEGDAIGAVVQIAARFAGLVVDRVNRSPEKHEIAFLNLIGAEPLPPRPARVPLTFALSPGSAEAVVPAGTQTTATPLEGEDDEVLFETERDLVVTGNVLEAVVVSDTETDTYAVRTAEARGDVDRPFAAFEGDRLTPHQLFVGCDRLLPEPGAKRIDLRFRSPTAWRLAHWPVSWSYWDGERWAPLRSDSSGAAVAAGTGGDGRWDVTLHDVPPVERGLVEHVAGHWLRAQLDQALPPGRSRVAPDSVAVGNRTPRDLELPVHPFGPTGSQRFFYLSADEAVGGGGMRVDVRIALGQAGVAPTVAGAGDGAAAGLRLLWTYRVGDEWRPLGESGPAGSVAPDPLTAFDDGTRALTRDGAVTFRAPVDWPREVHRNRLGRWLRVEVAGEPYRTPPRVEALDVTTQWELPTIGSVTLARPAPPPPRRPSAAAFETTVLDLGKDFRPLGEEPRYNDTFYLALPDDLVAAGRRVRLDVQLANPRGARSPGPPPVDTAGSPRLAWEMFDGQVWRAVTATDGTASLSVDGAVVVTVPAGGVRPVEVNGEEAHWLRARLVEGHYGEPATYREVVRKAATTTGTTATTTTTATTGPAVADPTATDAGVVYLLPVAATFAPPVVSRIEVSPADPPAEVAPTALMTCNGFRYDAPLVPPDRPFAPFTTSDEPSPALYLGFAQPPAARPTSLYLQVEPPRPEEVAAEQLATLDPASLAHLSWEYLGEGGWRPLVVADDTRSLARPDLVGFVGPDRVPPRTRFGITSHWLRLRWHRGYFPLPPRLRRIRLNTTWARQVTTVRDEILGSGNGRPGQAFGTAQTPVQPGQRVTVREPGPPPAEEAARLAAEEGRDAVTVTRDAADQPDETWVRWHHVPDLHRSGPRDRHYTVDPLTGTVRFGDGRRGLVPPPGPNNVRITYGTGGGEHGNRAAGTIVQLASGIPYVDAVTNHEEAQGGAPREPIDRLRARGPRALRHRDRAVTAQDLEDLAYEASAAVARVAAVVPTFDPFDLWLAPGAAPTARHADVAAGRTGVIVVPDSPTARPTPSLGLIDEVREHLRARSPSTADLWVAGPEWVRVTVEATVVATSLEVADEVGARCRVALERFVHPLTGGPAGAGWAFGRKPHRSDLFALLEAVDGVGHVGALAVAHTPETGDPNFEVQLRRHLDERLPVDGRRPPPAAVARWLGRALVYSGPHEITVALAP